jgi:hypothetical protein
MHVMNMKLIKVILLFFTVSILNSLSVANEIDLRHSYNKSEEGVSLIEFTDCGGHKGKIFIKKNELPAIIIPFDAIKDAKIIHYFCEEFYQPFYLDISVTPEYAQRLKKLYAGNVGKTFAEFLDNEMVSPLTIVEPTGRFDIGFGCLTFEKALMISINLGFQPDYNKICINKKEKIKDLSSSYKFKTKRDYMSPKKSPFWILSNETVLLNNVIDKKPMLRIPAQKVVEQYYDEKEKNFVRKDGYIKVMYQDKVGWIDSKTAIPFLSTLDNNVFLEKFFENHEQFYHSELISPQAVEKRKAIRNLYVEDAKNRFLNEEEFKRWYFDTFGRPFENKKP